MFIQTYRKTCCMNSLKLALLTCLGAFWPLAALSADVTIFAAASMKTALDHIVADWQTETDRSTTISYAGTAQLAQQIIAGAPADLFIAASEDWMDEVEAKGMIAPGSRHDLTSNRLVMVAPTARPDMVALTAEGVATRLEGGKLAMALVESVPAGQYGKAALTSLGLWDALQPNVAQAENVRAALALVALGEAPLGIVYASDATAETGVAVVAEFPADSHPPILYPMALIAGSTKPAAPDLLQFLLSDAAQARLLAAGFVPLAAASDP
jgi:molybdate transport system substrate-binding protein